MQIRKKQILSFLILTFIFSSFFLLSMETKAGSLWDTVKKGGLEEIGTTAYQTTDKPEDVRVIVARIIKVFLGLLGIIFLVLLVLAGFKWMNSQGNEEEVKKAKDQITVAVIGLLIILAAYGITNFVTRAVYKTVINDAMEL